MLRPRIQQLPPRPTPARAEVRADREEPANPAADQAAAIQEGGKGAVPAPTGTATASFPRVLCAGLFGWAAGAPFAYSGSYVPASVEDREG